jgi:hypothetical protein
MVQTTKISQFPTGTPKPGDLVTGLDGGNNTNFPDTSSSGVLPFTVITALTFQMLTNNGYAANNAGVIAFTIPTIFAVGDVLELANMNGGFSLLTNAGQNIIYGDIIVSNTISSTALGDAIYLKGVVANTTYLVIRGTQGNLNYT